MNTTPIPATAEGVITGELMQLDLGAIEEATGYTYVERHNAQLAELTRRVDALPDIETESHYEVNQKARTHLTGIRTGVDKNRKGLFEPLRALKEKVDTYLGTSKDGGLQARIFALECRIATKQQVWDAAKERVRQEKQRIIDERNAARAKRIIDLGMAWNGTMYGLDDLVLYPAELAAWTDDQFEAYCKGSLEPIREKYAMVERRFAELKEAGMEEDEDTGYLRIQYGLDPEDDDEPECMIVMREDLESWTQDGYVEAIKKVTRYAVEHAARNERIRIAREAKEAAQAEENERMRLAFARQAEDQKRMDEERAEIDKARADLRDQKQKMRHDELVALGAEKDPIGFYFCDGDSAQVVGDLAGLSDEDWAMAKGAITRAKERWDARVAESKRLDAIMDTRAEQLKLVHATYDGDSVWTLGEAATTDHALRTMNDDEWTRTLLEFKEQPVQGVDEGWKEDRSTANEILSALSDVLDQVNKAHSTSPHDVMRSHYAAMQPTLTGLIEQQAAAVDRAWRTNAEQP